MPKYRIEPVNKKSIQVITTWINGNTDEEIDQKVIWRFGSYIVDVDYKPVFADDCIIDLSDEFEEGYEMEVLSDEVSEEFETYISDKELRAFKKALKKGTEEELEWEIHDTTVRLYGPFTVTQVEDDD
jgi:hypothetical protein